jgi:ABC-2 type transport system permease protein
MPYLSSVFVQPESMPSWLRPISEHQPITPVIETVRSLLTGPPIENNGRVALAWCCGLFLLPVVLATSLYRRRTNR